MNVEVSAEAKSAFAWIVKNSKVSSVEEFQMEDGRTVRSTLYRFAGYLPTNMIYALRFGAGVKQCESSELKNEIFRLGGNRMQPNQCEYLRTEYEIL